MTISARAKSLQRQIEMMINNTQTKLVRLTPEDFELLKIHLLTPYMRRNITDSFKWKGIEIIKI